jgi:hypothetical protein
LVLYISSDTTEEIIHSDDAFAPVGYLNLKEAHVEDKNIVGNDRHV